MTGASPAGVAALFETACLAELSALKPGNVHRHAGGHQLEIGAFERSAHAAAPHIAEDGASVGRRIGRAVEASVAVTGTNTNLGIILLCAPLAAAIQSGGPGDLRTQLGSVLAGLTVADAVETYAAIRRADAGGMGQVGEHDIASVPAIDLRQAMAEAERRDRIAWNYVHGFADIFERGLTWLAEGQDRFGDQDWAVTWLYLQLLAAEPDSLIARKFGTGKAEEVRKQAAGLVLSFADAATAEALRPSLLDFDRALKLVRLNPGTTADLTVATLFAAGLQRL